MRPGEGGCGRIGFDIARLELVAQVARGAAGGVVQLGGGERCRGVVADISDPVEVRLGAAAADGEVQRAIVTDHHVS